MKPAALVLVALALFPTVFAEDTRRAWETFDEANTRRIREETANFRNNNPDFTGPRPSDKADWSSWDGIIARYKRRHGELPTEPPPATPTESGDSGVSARLSAQIDAAYEEKKAKEFQRIYDGAYKEKAPDMMIELANVFATQFYYPDSLKLPASPADTAMNHLMRVYGTSSSLRARIFMLGLMPSVLEPDRYQSTESPGAVMIFARGGIGDQRFAASDTLDVLRTRAARGGAFASLAIGTWQLFNSFGEGSFPAGAAVPAAVERQEIRAAFERVYAHCPYLGRYFIGSLLWRFDDVGGESVASLLSLIDNPNYLPGDTTGYYTRMLKDEARRMLATAHFDHRVPGASHRAAIRILRSCEGPFYAYALYEAAQRVFYDDLSEQDSLLEAAEDYLQVEAAGRAIAKEDDPWMPRDGLLYHVHLLRALAALYGDTPRWGAAPSADLGEAERELTAAATAVGSAGDPEARLRLTVFRARQGDATARAALDADKSPLARIELARLALRDAANVADAERALEQIRLALLDESGRVRRCDYFAVGYDLLQAVERFEEARDSICRIGGVVGNRQRLSFAEQRAVQDTFTQLRKIPEPAKVEPEPVAVQPFPDLTDMDYSTAIDRVSEWAAQQDGVAGGAITPARQELRRAIGEFLISFPVQGPSSPQAFLPSLRRDGTLVEWAALARVLGTYGYSQFRANVPLYLELREHLLALPLDSTDPYTRVVRRWFVEKFAHTASGDPSDPEWLAIMKREVAKGDAWAAMWGGQELLAASRANAAQAVEWLLIARASADARISEDGIHYLRPFSDPSVAVEQEYRPDDLVKYLRAKPLPPPTGGYWRDPEASRSGTDPNEAIPDTALMAALRQRAKNGDKTAGKLLAQEIASRRILLFGE